MYSTRSGLVLAFHGCDKSVRDKVVSGQELLLPSENDYDWLGNGIYFWEHDPDRALAYAKHLKDKPNRNKRNPIKEPAVLGAVINLGFCLDLMENQSLSLLKQTYDLYSETSTELGFQVPQNKKIADEKDLLIRKLDCAVIQFLHKMRELNKKKPYDAVRGVFVEGKDLYPNAGFSDKNHIQICVRNSNCILGYFIPREVDNKWELPQF